MEWERQNPRGYNWAGEGKSAETAVGIQMVRDEGRIEGCESANILADMIKAYERVEHGVLIREAQALGFPLAILKVHVALFGGPRRVAINNVFSHVMFSRWSIIAGSCFAPTYLRITVTRALDWWTARWPYIHITLYVDDLSLHMISTASHIGRVLRCLLRA